MTRAPGTCEAQRVAAQVVLCRRSPRRLPRRGTRAALPTVATRARTSAATVDRGAPVQLPAPHRRSARRRGARWPPASGETVSAATSPRRTRPPRGCRAAGPGEWVRLLPHGGPAPGRRRRRSWPARTGCRRSSPEVSVVASLRTSPRLEPVPRRGSKVHLDVHDGLLRKRGDAGGGHAGDTRSPLRAPRSPSSAASRGPVPKTRTTRSSAEGSRWPGGDPRRPCT